MVFKPEPTTLAIKYPAGTVYKARVALKNPMTGRVATTRSGGILNPTGVGKGRKAQFTNVMTPTRKRIPTVVAAVGNATFCRASKLYSSNIKRMMPNARIQAKNKVSPSLYSVNS